MNDHYALAKSALNMARAYEPFMDTDNSDFAQKSETQIYKVYKVFETMLQRFEKKYGPLPTISMEVAQPTKQKYFSSFRHNNKESASKTAVATSAKGSMLIVDYENWNLFIIF